MVTKTGTGNKNAYFKHVYDVWFSVGLCIFCLCRVQAVMALGYGKRNDVVEGCQNIINQYDQCKYISPPVLHSQFYVSQLTCLLCGSAAHTKAILNEQIDQSSHLVLNQEPGRLFGHQTVL